MQSLFRPILCYALSLILILMGEGMLNWSQARQLDASGITTMLSAGNQSLKPMSAPEDFATQQLGMDDLLRDISLDLSATELSQGEGSGILSKTPALVEKSEGWNQRFVEEKRLVNQYLDELDNYLESINADLEIRQRQEKFRHEVIGKLNDVKAALDNVSALTVDSGLTESAIKTLKSRLSMTNVIQQVPKVPEQLSFNALSRADTSSRIGSYAQSTIVTGIASTPLPEDLSETIEVEFTQSVQDLAAQLNNDPREIYYWVRNNIHYTPVWGALQSADSCLINRVCSAFDISSLMIALLRASGTPARYRMGTVVARIEDMTQWLGDFTDASSVADFMGSAGTPANLVSNAGQDYIRFDHVWVEAWASYDHDLASVSSDDAGYRWIALDAGFKAYTFDEGDVDQAIQIVDHDLSDIYTAVYDSISIDVDRGEIAAIDLSEIRNQIQTSLDRLVDNPEFDNSPVERSIREVIHEVLPGVSKYSIISTSSQFSSIPENLRGYISLSVRDSSGQNLIDSFRLDMPVLSTSPLSVVYLPSDPESLNFIQQFYSGDEFSLAEFETGDAMKRTAEIPIHLIRVRPEIQIEGIALTSGLPTVMGEEGVIDITLVLPSQIEFNAQIVTESMWSYTGILNASGLSPATMKEIAQEGQGQLEYIETIQQPNPGDREIIKVALERNRIIPILSWMAEVDELSQITALAGDIAFARMPTMAFMFPQRSFSRLTGVSTSAQSRGVIFDAITQNQVAVSHHGERDDEISFNERTGHMSSHNEAYSTAGFLREIEIAFDPVTTTTILSAALDQGISLYAFDLENDNTALTVLETLDESVPKESIRSYLASGYAVLIPGRAVLLNNQEEFGYIVSDPESGSASYLVSYNGTFPNGKKVPMIDENNQCIDRDQPVFYMTCGFWTDFALGSEHVGSFFLALALIMAMFAALASVIPAAVTASTALAEGAAVTGVFRAYMASAFVSTAEYISAGKLLKAYYDCRRGTLTPNSPNPDIASCSKAVADHFVSKMEEYIGAEDLKPLLEAVE